METLQIRTKSKEYPLYIGKGLRKRVSELIPGIQSYSAVYIITDANVAPLYLDDVLSALSAHPKVYHHVVPGGEEAKSFQQYYDCQTFALENELDRNSIVIALGGGVVGDLAGFVSATFMRGIPFIQVPTTLLAHDSSVGGKVGINHPLGKNLIGAFHQPDAVIYDIEILNSLPEKEWRSGFAEVIKHALIWDLQFFKWLKDEVKNLNDLRDEKLEYALKKGISVKASVVSEDEQEKGIRAYLNFGHTLAHAIEAELGYGKMSHGDAVAVGMLFATKISQEYYKKDLQLESLTEWFAQFGFPEFPKELKADRLLELMKKDKKAQSGIIRMVLMKEIGKVETVTLDDEYVYKFLTQECQGGS